MRLLSVCVWAVWAGCGAGFWDDSTTTRFIRDIDDEVRTSFFRWMVVYSDKFLFFLPSWWAWNVDNKKGRRIFCAAGISIDFQPITTAIILNTRTVVTAANPLDPYSDRQQDIRIWALGRAGRHTTPYRYRCWRVRRLLPRSLNHEHQVGPHGRFCTRHDISVVFTRDQMYIYGYVYDRYLYAVRLLVCERTQPFFGTTYMVGSGFRNMEHIRQNYKLYQHELYIEDIVNCEKYLPKYWGKFVCFLRVKESNRAIQGVQNGGGLVTNDMWCLAGIGAFDLRYNTERIFVFTDLRYYVTWLNTMCNITPGAYYDYCYQQWGVQKGLLYDGNGPSLFFPGYKGWFYHNVQYNLFPLG